MAPGILTVIDAAAAVPAFLGMQDNRGFAFFRIGYIDIHRADLHAEVAAFAFIGKYHRPARRGDIGQSVYFSLAIISSLFPLINACIVFIMRFVVFFEITVITEGHFSYFDLVVFQS